MTALLAADMLTRTSTGEAVTFWVLGTVALIGALGVVMAANAVYSAVFLAITMIILARREIGDGVCAQSWVETLRQQQGTRCRYDSMTPWGRAILHVPPE